MVTRSLEVVAFGSCYVDTNVENYPFGNDGIAPETELVGERYETVPGGSAVNFCRLLGEFGLRTAFIGMAGDDPNGDTLARLLEQHNVQAELVRLPDLLTNISFNVTNPDGEHIMLVAGTANASLSPDDVMPKLEQLLPLIKMLYLGGCFKLKAFEHAFAQIANLAKRNSVELAIDHGRVPEGTSEAMLGAIKALVLSAAYYLPSRDEFCKLWGVADIEEGLRRLKDEAPDLIVVVKDGANGAFYWSGDSTQQVKAERVEKVVNATGAGDSFNAGLIAALAKDQSLADAIAYGCRVAASKIRAEALPSL
ncbi:MAG: carbohydrate kinase family protein [Patescibacteria group bacterium]